MPILEIICENPKCNRTISKLKVTGQPGGTKKELCVLCKGRQGLDVKWHRRNTSQGAIARAAAKKFSPAA